jgi:ABC-type multidrug transport system fused ATPase/permease subunit
MMLNKSADRIIMMEDGRIAETGTYEQLTKKTARFPGWWHRSRSQECSCECLLSDDNRTV